ncbi:hypothetical protein JTE90_009816, partial [Oedothorax gibbosus]
MPGSPDVGFWSGNQYGRTSVKSISATPMDVQS